MGIEELKRALQEREKTESWRNKIVKEEPLLQLSEENRKSLVSRRAKFEQLSKNFSISEAENQPPKFLREPVTQRCSVELEAKKSAIHKPQTPNIIADKLVNEARDETKSCTMPTYSTNVTPPKPQTSVTEVTSVDNTNKTEHASEMSSKTESPNTISVLPSKVSMRPINKRRLPKSFQEKYDNVVLSKSDDTSASKNLEKNKESKKLDLGREFTKSDDNKNPVGAESGKTPKVLFKLPADAFQTAIIGRERCGVKLRRVDNNSPFPETMLIQFQGSRPLNVRSISPKFPKNCAKKSGSYLLITRDRLIIWNADDAIVLNKSKATQMAYDILSGKELTCSAGKVEIANDDRSTMCAFCEMTGIDSSINSQENVKNEKGCSKTDEEVGTDMSGETPIFKFDRVFHVKERDNFELLNKGGPPDAAVFHPSRVLLFDFLTEIYVWIGQNCDRTLISDAMKRAEELKNTALTDEQRRLFGIDSDTSSPRPAWTIMRKQSQGIADCIFRFKFEQWSERMAEFAQNTPRTEFLTPSSRTPVRSTKRPWSVPAVFGALSANAMSNRISSLCSDNAYFGIVKDEDKLVDDVAADLSSHRITSRDSLQLEGLELKVSDENVYTEKIVFLQLADEENLNLLDGVLAEFDHSSCYVIEWHYRIEREGIRKLNGDRIAVHETGRQRVAYFYWLGRESSIKDRSRCALALRKHDKDRQEHIRIEAGHEPPVFLNILNGEMIASGTGSGYFLIVGSSDNLFSAEELIALPELRSQGAYLRVINNCEIVGTVECWYGEACSPEIIGGAKKLAARLASNRGLTYNTEPRLLDASSLHAFSGTNCFKLLQPIKWSGSGPRLYRIYGNEGEELPCERYDVGINFTCKQGDLRDCILVDQNTRLWIWSEKIIRTFELKVADKLWYDISNNPRNAKEDAIVIIKGHEPDEFKALFPTWIEWMSNNDQEKTKLPEVDVVDNGIECKPQYLLDLLHERTRFRSIDELQRRQLPKGFDTKHLERYLSDTDFEIAFHCTREEYAMLPRWKQITLKKEAQLF